MKNLGTIFATEAELARSDAFFDGLKLVRESLAKTPDLSSLARRIVDGETRWYDGENRFAVVNASGRRLWFTKKGNDWFAA
jgi:hypothetical protein